MLAHDRGVLGVYYLLENVIHYYYCHSEGGKTAVKGGRFPPSPSLENTLRSSFHQNLKKPKAIVQEFFFGVRKNVWRKVIHLKVNKKRN